VAYLIWKYISRRVYYHIEEPGSHILSLLFFSLMRWTCCLCFNVSAYLFALSAVHVVSHEILRTSIGRDSSLLKVAEINFCAGNLHSVSTPNSHHHKTSILRVIQHFRHVQISTHSTLVFLTSDFMVWICFLLLCFELLCHFIYIILESKFMKMRSTVVCGIAIVEATAFRSILFEV
jgi:hypothetical protein